ncbi:MAG: PAS domain-containing protein [Parachlamydia sp.]|nr:PAS domain-containing protein [Parachlamydia sp.]
MFSFRQKILISFVIVFLIFIGLMFPFANSTVSKIVQKGMRDRAVELIAKIHNAPNDEALIRLLKEQKQLIFFRVSVITDERKVLYDSHTKRLLGPRFSQEFVVSHPEVLEAIKKGEGYHEEWSELLGQKFSYYAKAFDFHGKSYVIRTAFPYKYITELTHDFELGMIAVGSVILLLFSTMAWFIIHYLTQPIQQIIAAITPYQEGKQNVIPAIRLGSGPSDEFGKLADTLNSLSAKIQSHIDIITEERNEKQAILESLVEGVIAVDNKMVITYANQAALKLLHFEQHELLEQPFSTTHQTLCSDLLVACRSEQKALTETFEFVRNGRKYVLDIVATPIKDDSGAILILQDKTSHYRLLEMRKEFIANASHELKTPITIIRGFAETLHDNPSLPPETVADITEKILRNSNRMTNLIKDLLTLSDIENLPISSLSNFDLVNLVEHCRETVMNVHPTAQIRIESQPELKIIADQALMEHAMMNLIDNAAKYSNPPADIAVSLEDLGNSIRIRVADKGIGIPTADLDHVFERFYTVNKAHSRKLGGSGLGLSIVQNIVQKHNGAISVASELGKGTTFTIILPKQSLPEA